MIRKEPQTWEEISRQPLIWNSLVQDRESHQLGERKHIDWAIWDSGPAVSLSSWTEARLLDIDTLAAHFDISRGVRPRIAEIEAAIPEAWHQATRGGVTLPDHLGWWGCFSSQGTPLWARHGRMLFTLHPVQDGSPHVRLSFEYASDETLPDLAWVLVRVVGSLGRRHTVDPA